MKKKVVEKKDKLMSIQALAIEINKTLSPEPPLDEAMDKASLTSEIVELFPHIKSGHPLSTEAWKTIITLGWKETTEKIEKSESVEPQKEKKVKEKKVKVEKVKVEKVKVEKPKKVKEAGEKKGPGVIASIEEILRKGKPVSKDAILSFLQKRFPDRPENGMKKTIAVQLPKRMAKERKMSIMVTDNGAFLCK